MLNIIYLLDFGENRKRFTLYDPHAHELNFMTSKKKM